MHRLRGPALPRPDGMPDEWERKHGLNPADPADAARDANGDGYTNVEEYLNGRDPTASPTDWNDLRNNRDSRMPPR